MKIRITVTYELDEDPEDWPEDERSFEVIKEYIEGDYSYFMDDEPQSVVIEQIG